MNTLAILFGLLFSVGIAESPVQPDTSVVSISMADITDNGRLLLSSPKFNPSWKYHPGDNPEWSDPDFDDSSWYNIPPGGLRANEIPDSLWPGYGWWRIQFRADSSIYEENWNLDFYGWGAAEVYLDGELVKTFGNFSVLPENEITHSPSYKLGSLLIFTPGEVHTFAVRYSFHKAKKYQQIFKANATNLGFALGFSTPEYNEYLTNLVKYTIYTVSFTCGILFILFLIHFMLFLKFPEDRSNPVIVIVILSFLITSISAYSPSFIEYNTLGEILINFVWNLAGAFPFFILPYVIAILFRLKNYSYVIHFAWLFLLYIIFFYLDFYLAKTALVILFIVFLLCTFLIRKAYIKRRTGLIYIAGGIIGAIICVIIYWLERTGLFDLPIYLFYFDLTLVYTFIPFGLTLYITHLYGDLFGSMEKLVKTRTIELEESLENLQATQNQLIQQEKLASLGQLTAGIAHEIKNPLNFVNNFSDLSVELIEETKKELSTVSDQLSAEDKEHIKEANEILNGIDTNLRKIHEHGSRADSIVKSMLQHSRGGSGKIEPTDLNGLIKEFANLSFHGMRAGKNPINVEIDLQLDESVGDVPLVAEDFSRVILNICNNAFDAMREKANLKRQKSDEYLPLLKVQTNRRSDQLIVEIEDNGPGIPEAMKDKIFQPFFTSKKGTEGTGLGLSISNDIVKAHGGSIEIESKAGNYTRFLIKIPTQTN